MPVAASIPCVQVVDHDETIRPTVAEALELDPPQRPRAIELDMMMPVKDGSHILEYCQGRRGIGVHAGVHSARWNAWYVRPEQQAQSRPATRQGAPRSSLRLHQP